MGQTDRRTDGRPTVAYTPHTMRVVEMDLSHEYLTDLSTSPVRCSHFTLENSLKKSFFNRQLTVRSVSTLDVYGDTVYMDRHTTASVGLRAYL